jgi:hypothetical protein
MLYSEIEAPDGGSTQSGRSAREAAMDEPRLVTAAEILREQGREIFDRMLGFGWHHTDDRGEPFWTEDKAVDILILIDIADREENRAKC